MRIEPVHYQNTDVLIMDPCYSREYGYDEDFELDCIDLVVDTYADGYYCAIKGSYEEMQDMIDDLEDNPGHYSLGEFTLDTARIGVYDYQKAIEEQPSLKARLEKKEILAAIIKNFTGTVTAVTDDDDNAHVVGKSDDGEHDFFTVRYYH